MNCPRSVSAAKLFLQLAPAKCAPPVLDFLLPRAQCSVVTTSTRALRRGMSSNSSKKLERTIRRPNTPTARFQNASCTGAPWTSTHSILYQSRSMPALTFTSTRRYTQTAYNPQKDDDGNEMKLEITPRAAKRLSDIMKKDDNPYLALRIQVESGGCHGFQYLISLVTLPPALPAQPAAGADAAQHPGDGAESGEIREDDTIFTYTKDEQGNASKVDLTAPKIILDQPSLELLKGSKIDYTMELIGSQFKVVDNPAATSNCGCGSSFDIKF